MDNNWGKPYQDDMEARKEKRKEIMKAILMFVLIPILVIGLFIGLGFGFGYLGVSYKNTIGVADANADRKVFKENKSYVEGMISDLAKYKYELSTEKDAIARKAIVELIVDKFANFSPDRIEDIGLKNFLIKIKNGE
jgi:hypothetical protein